MSNARKIKLEGETLKQFIQSVSKINDQAIIGVSEEGMYSIVASDDKALFLWASIEGDYGDDITLNMPSLKKFLDLLKIAKEDTIELTIKSNRLEYRGDKIKFDYYLLDDGILTKPKVTIKKIKSLDFDYQFTVDSSDFKTLLKNGRIMKDSNKLYIKTEDKIVKWVFGDENLSNIDSVEFTSDIDIGKDIKEDFIINVDNLQLLNVPASTKIKFDISEKGIGKLSFANGDLKLNYIISSLTK